MNYGDRRLPERFWEKVSPEPTTGCWLWTASTMRGGYGQFAWRWSVARTHKVAYVALVGPVPDGLVLDHRCDTPCCVNPAHLRPVTQRENVQRSPLARAHQEELAARQRAKTHCRNGHSFAEHAHALKNGRRGCGECRRLRYLRTGR